MRNSKGQFVKGNVPWIKGRMDIKSEHIIEHNRLRILGVT